MYLDIPGTNGSGAGAAEIECELGRSSVCVDGYIEIHHVIMICVLRICCSFLTRRRPRTRGRRSGLCSVCVADVSSGRAVSGVRYSSGGLGTTMMSMVMSMTV